MIIAWSGGLHTPVASAAPDAGNLQQQRARHAELLKRLCELGDEELKRAGADPSDVGGKAAALESDPQKIFAFVRDEIAYEPYRGVLRGARGTLAAGAGNGYDKSLLLQEMLQAGGHKARLVKGRLPSDRAASIVKQFLQRDAAAGPLGAFAPAGASPATAAADDVITRAAAAAPELQKIIADARAATDALLTQATDMTGREATYLQEQLTNANVTIGRPLEAWSKELEARAADHVWVEWETGDGQTTALDPCFADTEPGKAVGLSGRPVTDAQLASARHTVRFQLTYRHENGSAVKAVSLLDVTLPAERGLFDALEFSIVPADELPPVAELTAMSQEESIKFWTGFKSYQPVLAVGSKRHLGRAFDLNGGVFSAGAGGPMKGFGGLGRAAGGLFAEKGPGSDKPGGTFIDLAALVTVQSPGDKPVQHQRVLVAKADVTGEHFLSPILGWQMLVQPQVVSAELAGHAALRHKLAALKPIVPLLSREDFGDAVLSRISSSAPAPAYPALLMDLAVMRQVGMARAAAETPAAIPLWDRPQVMVAERRFCAMRDGSHTCGRFATDIMTNRMSFVPREPGDETGAAAAAVALRQGVLDTALEALVVRRVAPGEGAAAAAITDSEQVRTSGGSFAVVAPRDAVKPSSGVGLSPSDAAWVARYEPESNHIIAPSTAASPAAGTPSVWWSLDPQTGSVVGRRDGGRGQAMTEYAIQVSVMSMCIIFTMAAGEISGVDTPAARAGQAIAGLGCIAGGGAGIGAIGLQGGSAHAATIIAALMDGVFQLLGAYVGRED
jgi:cytochrome c556